MNSVTPSPLCVRDVLAAAGERAGFDAARAELVRDGSNVLFRLPGGVVARVGREDTYENAERQVELSRWLLSAGVPTVRALEGVPQPTVVHHRPVTWWEELPEHRPATPGELGAVLRSLHALKLPAQVPLPELDPLAGIAERISSALHLHDEDRAWLTHRVTALREQYNELPGEQEICVVHGDAWQGNFAVSDARSPVVLDLERVAQGHADWDLIPLAADYADFARLTEDDYRQFVLAYGGYDVLTSARFRVLADIQELRWATFVLGRATASPGAAREAQHRLACLRGCVPRPWKWTAL
ncbi:phosphotransferase [Haloechinothrix sp. LS1_15]|uniref:phosphotransferase family protein n=1 Tax=Haloechinothrix sp. LS1_15 TaxID=2652248 RepID=UPI0029450830|nr:phosphotransferase [Haloechinothrix sp. LS1_15]MDV6011666.1 aminoglycoside phosphotransferase family protein [Haloechinothrix sp. LS1_15]